MNNQPCCVSTWRDVDTSYNDQQPDEFEGLSALFDLRRQGFLPQEEPEPEIDFSEVCF